MSESGPHLRLVTSPPIAVDRPREISSDLVDEIALSLRLGVSRSTLQSWRYSNRGPRYIKVGRLIRYRNAEVEAYLHANSCGHPA